NPIHQRTCPCSFLCPIDPHPPHQASNAAVQLLIEEEEEDAIFCVFRTKTHRQPPFLLTFGEFNFGSLFSTTSDKLPAVK
ncbi:hypothetical protein TorRG33x02_349150, partial [Trema orientale]